MAGITSEVRNAIESYLADISLEIKVDRAILFGSYAKGTYHEDSDIDLAIFTDSFRDLERVDGIKYLLKKARKYRDVDLQPIPFTNQDYRVPLGIVEEILKTGIEVYPNWSTGALGSAGQGSLTTN